MGCCDEVCVFRGHSTEDFISLPSSGSSEVLSALISLPPEALPREERRVREIAGVLPHHPRNIDCLITVALQPIINTTGLMEAEKEECRRRRRCCSLSKGGAGSLIQSDCLKCINSPIHFGFLLGTHTHTWGQRGLIGCSRSSKAFVSLYHVTSWCEGAASLRSASAHCATLPSNYPALHYFTFLRSFRWFWKVFDFVIMPNRGRGPAVVLAAFMCK